MRLMLALLAVTAAAAPVRAEDRSPYRLVTPKSEGIIATGLNGKGDLIGFEWAEEADRKGVIEQVPIFARGGKDPVRIPLLKGYTATFPLGISDGGSVVGRSSKPGRPGERIPLRNQGFVWDKDKGIRGLGVIEGDWASIATAISADGSVIAGYSVGENQVRVCVWEKDRAGEWKASALPKTGQMSSQVVAMSPDGRKVATLDGPSPYLWTRTPDGWDRKEMGGPASMAPRAVNNAGTVVGVRLPADGSQHAVIWTAGKGTSDLEMPKDFVRSEAASINNKGEVVGWADGPPGSDLGPRAIAWVGGKPRLLDEFRSMMSSATVINDAGQVSGIIEKDEELDPKTGKPKAP